MNDIDITVGVPTYNEEANILKFFNALRDQLLTHEGSTEVIFIDDSDDKTAHIIDNLRLNCPELNI